VRCGEVCVCVCVCLCVCVCVCVCVCLMVVLGGWAGERGDRDSHFPDFPDQCVE